MARRDADYREQALDPAMVAAMPGLVLLDFGTGWCGHCDAARAPLARWLEGRDDIDLVRVEDGPGRRLGRAFRIKLWPTLVLLRDGNEIARAVRPRSLQDLQPLDAALA